MRDVRMRDVAKQAGVSMATVSRVMNNQGNVSPETAEKINRAISELDYHPNLLARNLFHDKTNIVGVIVPSVVHPFFSMLTEQLEIFLFQEGYKLMLCNTLEDTSREQEILRMLRENKVDGIIVNNHRMLIDDYAGLRLPVVSLDMPIGDIPCVAADHRLGGSMAAVRMIEGKCQKVLQFMGDPRVKTITHDRHTALRDMLVAHRIECITYELKDKEYSRTDYAHIINQLFDEYPDVDGVFAVDMIAAEVVNCAHKRGILIPEQLQVVGYDGTWLPGLIYPPITTVCQPIQSIAHTMVETLCGLIEGEDPPRQTLIPSLSWLEGETTRAKRDPTYHFKWGRT